MSVDRKSICPNCGAKLTGLELKCPECGYVLTAESGASQNTTESLLTLQEKLLAVDKVFTPGASSSKKKATIINAFPIPNTTESLIRLLHLSYSNFEASKEAGDKKLSLAWLGKAVESYRRLEKADKDDAVTSALEEYKVLGDKKVFAKLSGSYSKKRNWIISGVAIVAILAAFVLWYDWAGLLVKNGKEETAVRLLSFLGRKEIAIKVLEEGGRFEKAAELLSSRGQMIDAVSLLARNGLIKEALIMIGQSNSADSIHTYVDAISKYCLLKDRTSYYKTSELGIEGGDAKAMGRSYDTDTTFLYYYGTDKSLRRESIHNHHRDAITWIDYLDVMKDFPRPEPYEFIVSFFQKDYYDLAMSREYDPDSEVIRNGLQSITKITLAPLDKVYEFYYGGLGDRFLAKERVYYKGTATAEVVYEYGRRGELLSSVKETYLLSPEEIDSKYTKDEAPYSKWHSNTLHYDYSNGHLDQIRMTLDYYKDFLTRLYTFEYYDNVRIRTMTDIDYSSGERTTSPDVSVEFSLNDFYVESFVVSL